MKMGLLQNPDMETEKFNVEFLVTVPHDVGVEIESGARKTFFPLIRRGTPYEFAKKCQVFTLSGSSPEDMSEFYLKILERINKEDKLEDCKVIGELDIKGLPKRPSGKTKLGITLMVEEEGGLVKGSVEDLGFGGEYDPSGFKENFEPSRFKKSVFEGAK
jgi:molecular chaperone DnaK (HSP70)